MRVEIAAEAEADLDAIAEYIATDNADRALDFVRELREACERIAVFAKRFPLVREDDQTQIRKVNYRKYLIFFQIEQETVYVINILHAATDHQSRLLGE